MPILLLSHFFGLFGDIWRVVTKKITIRLRHRDLARTPHDTQCGIINKDDFTQKKLKPSTLRIVFVIQGYEIYASLRYTMRTCIYNWRTKELEIFTLFLVHLHLVLL